MTVTTYGALPLPFALHRARGTASEGDEITPCGHAYGGGGNSGGFSADAEMVSGDPLRPLRARATEREVARNHDVPDDGRGIDLQVLLAAAASPDRNALCGGQPR